MISILLTLTFEGIKSSDITHTGMLSDEPLQPINIREAFIAVARRKFGAGDREFSNVADAFANHFTKRYMGYLDQSIKYCYSLLFKKALIEAKESFIGRGNNYEAKLIECNDKANALLDQALKIMKLMNEDFESILNLTDENPMKQGFKEAIAEVIKEQHTFLQSLNAHEIVNRKIVAVFIESFIRELKAIKRFDQQTYDVIWGTVAKLLIWDETFISPILPSPILDELTVQDYGTEDKVDKK